MMLASGWQSNMQLFFPEWQRRRIQCGSSVFCALWDMMPFNSWGKLPLCSCLTRIMYHLSTQPSWRSSLQLLAAGDNISCQHRYFLLSNYHVLEVQQKKIISLLTEIWWLRRCGSSAILSRFIPLIYHTHLTQCSVLYVFPKVGEGNSCTFTQPLRGWVTLPRWQPEVHFLPVSACVTCASGSTCTALTRWEHWRWFNRSPISINNSKSFVSGL